MATAARLLTVEEFMALEPSSDVRQELHHGELVEMPPAKLLHARVQQFILAALARALSKPFVAWTEFAFRPRQEHEVWIADVAIFNHVRQEAEPENNYFFGAPEVVIEVLSPSNSASEMLDREAMCLNNGGREFWVCDPKASTVRVTTAAGQVRTYRIGDSIPLGEFGEPIAVSEFFTRP